MREIKFRAWNFENKIMYYPSICHDEKFVMQLNCGYIGEFNGNRYDTIKMNLLQYTGLKDKNDKDIYEGDVVNCNRYESKENYEVVVRDIRQLPVLMFGSNLNYLEVIGNIYEHPELLSK